MKTEVKVKCNNCDWIGTEDELELIGVIVVNDEEIAVSHESRVSGIVTILKQVDAEEFIDGCPNCLTDDYLMDMEN